MILRPRQTLFVERSLAALDKHKNTLSVASTGFGKTIALSAVTGKCLEKKRGAKACVLAHREELTKQNNRKFLKVNPHIKTSVVDSNNKSWDGAATFAMVQTLSRENNIKQLPELDLLVIDEAHHATADSYRRIIDAARDKNPDLAVFGVTATPNRGDKKGLRCIFSNVADQVTLGELIVSGHLVPPTTYTIDVGTQQALFDIKKTAGDFDMDQVSEIMNNSLINEEVIKHWKEKAEDRPTIIFCSTVEHAKCVAADFIRAGIKTEVIHDKLTKEQRKDALKRYENGLSKVIVNVAILTEGYDHPPTSCVILLRPSSYQSTMIQMIGRGLRTVDPSEYPGVIKTDCIVLDFGTSSIIHGRLEQSVDLDGVTRKGAAPTKNCPECATPVPLGVYECPLCGHLFEKHAGDDEGGTLSGFVMSEIDLLSKSPFKWTDLFNDGSSMLATGFDAWAGTFFLNGTWYSVGGRKKSRAKLLAVGEKAICFASSDDWLNENETEGCAEKSRKWSKQPANQAQLKYLKAFKHNYGLTRYSASCLLAFHFNKRDIQKIIFDAAKTKYAVA